MKSLKIVYCVSCKDIMVNALNWCPMKTSMFTKLYLDSYHLPSRNQSLTLHGHPDQPVRGNYSRRNRAKSFKDSNDIRNMEEAV